MNAKKNTSKRWLLFVPALIVITALVVFLVQRFEGEAPVVNLNMASSSLGADQSIELKVSDTKSGIRKVWVGLIKDGTEIELADKSYPSAGFLTGGLNHEETLEVPFEPLAKGIKDGKAILRISVRDYSWRDWGKGNLTYQEKDVLVDTRPPGINVLSRPHYFSQGGSGLVIYRLSEQCQSSGVMVGETFYPGYATEDGAPNTFMVIAAVAYDQGPTTSMQVVATDLAGNKNRVGLQHLINARHFRNDTIRISDQFLDWKMPEFAGTVGAGPGSSNLDIFLKVNGELRKANYDALKKATSQSENKILWKGAFVRLPSAANRAGFADTRDYVYKGKKIDRQTHLGLDLASIAQSPVPAGNNGKVVFAENLGIYGQAVILDHGLGLFSMYAHLSSINVSPGQLVAKGDIIGNTGLTGLAGGDHLHYSILVNHTFVNPVEWWDPQWIQNNIVAKIEKINTP